MRAEPTVTMYPEDHLGDQGSFITGFTVGLLAGAVGYFLFATEKGEKVREELMHEWQMAEEELKRSQAVRPLGETLDDIGHDMVAQSHKQISTWKVALRQAVSDWVSTDFQQKKS